MKHSIDAQIAEVGREIGLRRNVYPGFVSRGKMRQAEADMHIDVMEAAYATLKWIRDHEAEIREDLRKVQP